MPVEVVNSNGKANIVLVCEHASNHIPPEYDNLGLSSEHLEKHIAWDIGIEKVTRYLSDTLNAPAVIARFSRLLIDANRALDQAGLVPPKSDNINIPGNQNLCEQKIKERIDRFYTPFHEKTGTIIQQKSTNEVAPLIFNMHSFTPIMNNEERIWHTGMLWNRDPRIANVLIKNLKARGFTVGNNEPYSGKELNHTMNAHGTRHGFPHVNIEIRQNEIDHDKGVEKWGQILTEEIQAIREMPEMADIIHF